ncbi:MAG: hypothetical protein MMC33_001349 [Icmadophila ericetorum]|nr:hypothetical protein [Icmadophila ericetorum]
MAPPLSLVTDNPRVTKHSTRKGTHHRAKTLVGRVGESDKEDLVEGFPSRTSAGNEIRSIFEDGAGYFMRLDACSPKDAPGGTKPITTIEEIWRRIACSRRATAGIRNQRERDGVDQPIELFLVPWNDKMRTELEYRVFCPPPTCEIAVASQYRWLEPWHFTGAKDDAAAEEKAKEVLKWVREVHGQ